MANLPVNKTAHPFDKARFEALLNRRFFYAPAFEIYGGESFVSIYTALPSSWLCDHAWRCIASTNPMGGWWMATPGLQWYDSVLVCPSSSIFFIHLFCSHFCCIHYRCNVTVELSMLSSCFTTEVIVVNSPLG